MPFRSILSLGAVAFALAAVPLPPVAQAPPQQQPPNIVVLLADDLGWGDLGYHGAEIETPNIDRLAKEGVRLENFHAAPLCSPTRAGLMTGRWPIRYGMGASVITPWRRWGLPTSERTLADLLAGAGYTRRGVFGKWHLGHYRKAFLPLNRGFTDFYGHYNGAIDYFTHEREGELDWHRGFATSRDEGYTSDLIGREAARFIEASPAGRPFLLYVPFNAPHLPLQAKEQDIAKYSAIEDEDRRIYAAMIDLLDQAIGRILAALDARGAAENTFVLFFSDNGAVSSRGDNGAWRGGKGDVYEGGVRVPAVARWPAGLDGGREVHAMMGYVDVYPTLKRIAGVTSPDANPLDGRDMLDVIRGTAPPPQRDWFSYIAQGSPDRAAVTDGTWKLVAVGGSVLEVKPQSLMEGPGKPRIELFRLDQDPGERKNLLAAHPEIAARLLERLQEFRRLKLDGIPDYREGREGFSAPKDWLIKPPPSAKPRSE